MSQQTLALESDPQLLDLWASSIMFFTWPIPYKFYLYESRFLQTQTDTYTMSRVNSDRHAPHGRAAALGNRPATLTIKFEGRTHKLAFAY